MPGFFVSNRKLSVQLHNRYPECCFAEELELTGATCKRNTLNKFMQDKVLTETNEFILVMEGYLLNKVALFEMYEVETVADLMQTMYRRKGEKFFSEFCGSFSGAIYDKSQDLWLVFTNQVGSKGVFYILKDNMFMAGSQVNYLISACKNADVALSFDEEAAYQMLTFGFMEANATYAKEIKRLQGGAYLRIDKGVGEVCRYHQFVKNAQRFAGKSEAEIIEELDRQFSNAVELALQKDVEYNYDHLMDISGGLDSRMSVWVAHKHLDRKLQLITYSKSNYIDEMVAKGIAEYWKDELLIKPLDDASFLYEVDELVALSGGLSLYSGITGGKRMLESLNMNKFGLEHTGLLYGGMIGSYIKKPDDMVKKEPSGMYSDVLKHRISDDYKNQAPDHELYLLHSRGFRGIMNTIQIRENFTEVATPSIVADFVQTCIDIPVELRMNHKLYKKWILAKHPTAAEFKWERIDGKITDPKWFLFGKKVIKKGPNKILTMLKLRKDSASGMNPVGYWITHNKQLGTFLNQYEQEGYSYLPDGVSQTLIGDMKKLYATGNGMEKTMVLTVLGAAKFYFG